MEILSFDKLKELIAGIGKKRVMLTFHSVGDTDAVAAAYALKLYLDNASIVAPDRITANARHILERLGMSSEIPNVFDSSMDVVIMLDVNNFEDCGAFYQRLMEFKGKIIMIDHHLIKMIDKEVYVFNSEDFSATSSIVFELLSALGAKIDRNTAILLALGIISDSAEFKNSKPLTFEQIAKLMKIANIDYPSLLEYVQHTARPEEREELLLSMVKSHIAVKYGLLFVEGFAERNANIVADNAIKIGADVALFYSIAYGEVSFSARLRPPLDKKLGIHLGYVMKKLAYLINGTGGGHPCAAGAYGNEISGIEDFIGNFNLNIKEHAERVLG